MRKFLPVLILCGVSSCARLAPERPGYLVFFTARSADIDAPAAGVIAAAAAAAKEAPDKPVRVIGYANIVGTPQDDVVLSQLRAQRVTDALVADGVAPGRITHEGLGQTGKDPGVADRRVEIDIGG